MLVVEDEENISFLLDAVFRIDGFETSTAATGADALIGVEAFKPDLILLDVMLPDVDGFEVCRRLRAGGIRTPIIFLTAKDATEDRVRGLTIGGDDYVIKPFAVEEVVARARVVLRRTGFGERGNVMRYADLELDEDAHRVTRGGRPVSLSPTEYKLLRYLLVNAERVVSKSQILDHVWDYDFDGESTVVETFMSYLRRKVDNVEPRLLQTVRGVGYCLRRE